MKSNKWRDSAVGIKEILQRARNLVGSSSGWNAWAMIFDLEPNDKVGVLKRLIKLCEDVDELKYYLRSIDVDKDRTFLPLLDELKEFFISSDLNARWKVTVKNVDNFKLARLDRLIKRLQES